MMEENTSNERNGMTSLTFRLSFMFNSVQLIDFYECIFSLFSLFASQLLQCGCDHSFSVNVIRVSESFLELMQRQTRQSQPDQHSWSGQCTLSVWLLLLAEKPEIPVSSISVGTNKQRSFTEENVVIEES